jgi:excisionase family DNA binding protein
MRSTNRFNGLDGHQNIRFLFIFLFIFISFKIRERMTQQANRQEKFDRLGVAPLLDASEVCVWLNVSLSTLSRLVHGGQIPYVPILKGKTMKAYRFRRSEVERWLNQKARSVKAQNCKDGLTKDHQSAQS